MKCPPFHRKVPDFFRQDGGEEPGERKRGSGCQKRPGEKRGAVQCGSGPVSYTHLSLEGSSLVHIRGPQEVTVSVGETRWTFGKYGIYYNDTLAVSPPAT